MKEFSDGLKNLRKLKSLDLNFYQNEMEDEAAIELSTALLHLTGLT